MSDLEQQEELEVLESIFPTEFRRLDAVEDVPSHWSDAKFSRPFTIDLKPSDFEIKKAHVEAQLLCGMPHNYPTEVPILLDVRPVRGLGPDQVEELMNIGERVAAENLGMPSAYSVAMALQEWLTENNLPGNDGSMYSEMVRRQQKKVVEEKKVAHKQAILLAAESEQREDHVDEEELERLRRRQAGQAVTVETFMAWKQAFDRERLAERGGLKVDADDGKPNGKQWFLQQQASGQMFEDEERMMAGADSDDFVLEDAEQGGDDSDDSDYVDGESDGDDDDYSDSEETPRKAGVS